MTILLDNLPDDVSVGDVKDLVRQYGKVESVTFVPRIVTGHHESCFVTMMEANKLVMDDIAHRIDGHYWKGAQISAHSLLFG